MAGIEINLAVDSSRNRVLFADAGSEFVDVLLSFLTLPLSAVELCAGASLPGCLSSLRESVSQLNDSNLLTPTAGECQCHGMLLRPHADELQYFWCQTHAKSGCKCFRMLLRNHKQGYGSGCQLCWTVMERVAHVCNQATATREMFVQGKLRFVISDDLVIKPASTSSTLTLLQKMGSDGLGQDFEEVQLCVGLPEVLSMLKASVSSQTVLTKTFLSKESDLPTDVIDNTIVDPKIQHQCNNDPDSSQYLNIRIFYDRCKKRVMYAECKHNFVDLLLSFLTYPVGSLFKNLAGTSHLGCSLDNLYSSAVDLNVSGLLGGPCSPQKTLLDPSITPFIISNNALERTVPEWFNMGRICGDFDPQFSKDVAYVVDDCLLISQASAILVMKYWRKVNKDSVLEMDVAVCKQEAVDLLRAALTSKAALTDVLMSRLEEACVVL